MAWLSEPSDASSMRQTKALESKANTQYRQKVIIRQSPELRDQTHVLPVGRVARPRAGDHGIELLKVFVEGIVVEDEAVVVDEDGVDCD